ncbi:ADP-ribosylglycohydrolase family protein [Rothia nasimurium]|uniref:ADP-ribosylglycohydrolase family protein n=1 Tax=Rothia nasimurium TaxID=85336 RepID=UPI001F3F023C|nr:ADP-ribosylglycohydrolase family protein [Rothia nasimurium]
MTSVFPAPDALSPAYRSALRGSLLGTALGDALGYPLETSTADQITERWGGRTGADLIAAIAREPLLVSDDTQLTLATLDGLTEVLEWNNEGQAADELACIWLAYLRWYTGTGHPVPETAPYSLPRPLDALQVMRQQRGPGKATLAALATGEMQFISKNINPQALGTGALMRSAPFGYLPVADDATVIKLSAHAAALTHGHPEAIISASAYALLIRYLLGSASQGAGQAPRPGVLEACTQQVLNWLGTVEQSQALPGDAALTRTALGTAVRLAQQEAQVADACPHFGELLVAPDVLGYALFLALRAEADVAAEKLNQQQAVREALGAAIAVTGDSDSIGALVGSLLGALWGDDTFPADLAPATDAAEALNLVEVAWFKQLGV